MNDTESEDIKKEFDKLKKKNPTWDIFLVDDSRSLIKFDFITKEEKA